MAAILAAIVGDVTIPQQSHNPKDLPHLVDQRSHDRLSNRVIIYPNIL